MLTSSQWHKIKNSKDIYTSLTDDNKRKFWEFGTANGLVDYQNITPENQAKLKSTYGVDKDFYDPKYIDKKSTTQSLGGSEADKQLAEIQKDEARFATDIVPNRVVSNASKIAEAVEKGKVPPTPKYEYSKKFTVAPVTPYTTTPITKRPVVNLGQTNKIQNLKESSLEPQLPTEYKRPSLPVSNRLQEDFNIAQPQAKLTTQKQYAQLTPREQQIALGLIRPTEEERQALNVKMSATPESTFAQSFFKGGSFGATSLIGSDAEKQARLQGAQQNQEAAISGQIAGSLIPQGMLYKVLNKAIQGTALGAKLLGSANLGTKIAASQGAQLLADRIIQTPVEYFNGMYDNKNMSEVAKTFALNAGIDILINGLLAGIQFTPQIREALRTKAVNSQLSELGTSADIIEQAIKNNDESAIQDIKEKLDVFYVNQYGVAGKSIDEVSQPLLSAPEKMDAFTKWRQKNFGGAFGKTSEEDLIALKQLYKEDTGVDLIGNQKERPFVVAKSELANKPDPIVPTLKPVQKPVDTVTNPIVQKQKVQTEPTTPKVDEPTIPKQATDSTEGLKPSKFETNTVKRTTVIEETVKKQNLEPNSMDYVPETVKQWDEQAVKNVAEDIEGVKVRIRNANSIEGGTTAHEAALITAKLQEEALKTGDFTEFKKWINEVAEKTRETARGLKGTDTAWEKSSVSAVNKLNRTIIKAQEELVERTPKLKKAMDNEFNAIKSTYENLPSDEEAIKQMILDLESALKNSSGKQKIKMNLQLFAAKQKLKSLSEVSGDFDPEYVKNWIKKQYGVPTLEDDDIKQIVKFVDQSQNATDDYMKRAYISQAKKIISSKQASTVGEKIRGSLRISMLLNPKTLFTRNPVGNVLLGTLENIKDAPGTLIDKLVSLKTGERTTSLSLSNLAEQTKGFKKGLEEFAKDVRFKIDTNPTGAQMEAVDKILFKASERDWKIVAGTKNLMNSLDRATKLALQLGDRPFYEAALSGRLNELKRLGKDISDPSVITNAKLYALERVFQNDSEMAKRISTIRDNLGIAGYAVMPFTKTPANILDKLTDYTPIGLGKAVYHLGIDTTMKGKPFNQKLFVDRLARSLTGLGIMGLGGIMYDKGILTEGYNKDADVRDVQKRMGIQPYAITNGKDYYTIDWASPVASLLIAGLEYRKASKDNKEFAEKIAKGTEAGANSLLNSSLLRGVLDTLSGYSPAAGIAKGVMGGTSQFLPTAIGQATRLSDKYERETGGTVLGNLASKTPIARQNLPIKLDVYGKEIEANQGRGFASRAFQEFISPGFYSSNKGNDVDKELIRLYNSTEIKKMFPKLDEIKPSNYTDQPVIISPEKAREFRKIVGQKTLDLYSRFINSEYYKGLETDKEKANALYNEMEDLRDEVSREFLKKQGVKITK